MRFRNTLVLLLIYMLPMLLAAWPNYKTVGTPNFDVYYRDGWETEALNILQALEYSRPYVEGLTGNYPGKVPVVLADMGNIVNGYASPMATKMGLFAYPPTGNELGLSEDWWQLVGVHEYIHMAQMTRTTGEPALLRALFGNILYPNLYQPMWMTEGITVYGESQLSKNTGRLNAGTYPAIIGALAREGRLPGPGKACYYSYSNPLGNYYVYGSSFHEYLAKTYGEDKFSILYGETASSLAAYLNPITSSFSLDKSYEAAYGKNVDALWTEWQASAFRESSPLPTSKITDDGWQKQNLDYHDGNLYYIHRNTDKTGPSSTFSSYRLLRLSNPEGKKPQIETLVEQNSEFTAGYQIRGNKLYYTRGEFKGGYANNDYDGLGVVTELWEQDLGGGNRRHIYTGPVRAFCRLEDSRFILAEDDETHQKTVLKQHSTLTGINTTLGTIDGLVGTIHQHQGRIFVTHRGFWKNNSIYELNLSQLSLTPVIDSPAQETVSAVRDGKIFFNATYEGKNSSLAYDLASKTISQYAGYSEVKDAIPLPTGETYFLSINGDGYDIYKDQLKTRAYSLPQSLSTRPPYPRLEASKDNLVNGKYPVQRGSYAKNIGHMLWPRIYRLPYIGVSDPNAVVDSLVTLDNLIIGAQFAGSDVIGDFPMWTAAVLYDVPKKHWGYQIGLENNFFSPIKHQIEYSDLGDERTLSSIQYIPFLQRLNYGLSSAYAGFDFNWQQLSNHKLWNPFLGLNFSGPGIRLQTRNNLLFERQSILNSARDRLGWQGTYSLRLKMPLSSEFRSTVYGAWDPDAGANEVFAVLRGYDTDWNQNKGVTFSNSLYTPLIRIRNGIWNPNIYIEDINLGLFYDYAHPGDNLNANIRYSYGAELIAEIFAGYVFNLNLGVRVSRNREGNYLTSLILGI